MIAIIDGARASAGSRRPAGWRRLATSSVSRVSTTSPVSGSSTSSCSIVVSPLLKLVVSSSDTRCVRPSDPAKGIGAWGTSATTGVKSWEASSASSSVVPIFTSRWRPSSPVVEVSFCACSSWLPPPPPQLLTSKSTNTVTIIRISALWCIPHAENIPPLPVDRRNDATGRNLALPPRPSVREARIPEAHFPRMSLLGHLQHPKVTRSVDSVRCLRGSPFGIRAFGGCEFRPFGGGPISLLLPLSRGEKIGEQRQTNGSQTHRDGSAQNPTDPSRSPPFLLQSPSGTERKDVE